VTIAYSAHKVKSSLRYSVLDGSAWAAMQGLTQSYITPFALALNATTTEVGFLASIPNLIMALSQLSAHKLSARAHSRKAFILPVVFGHAVMWIPMFLIPFLIQDHRVWYLIGFVTISTVMGAIANPSWNSMMADLVPSQVRGRYFSLRNRITGLIVLVASLLGGLVLQIYTNNVYLGFCFIFAGAAGFRFISLYFLSKMYEPPNTDEKTNGLGMWQMITSLPSSNFGKFTIYIALINFASAISAPFFAVFMLRDLHFSYSYYLIIICTNAVANMAFQTFWGRRADLAGNLRVIQISSMLLPVVPLMWLFSSNIGYLVFEEVISGFAWGGFLLAGANFVLDATDPEHRTKQIALYNAIVGLAIFGGSLIGGYIAPLLPEIFGYQLRTLFAVSGVMRGLIIICFLHTIMEVRHVPQVNLLQFIRGGLNPSAMKKVVFLSN
jgi:MFS family permease